MSAKMLSPSTRSSRQSELASLVPAAVSAEADKLWEVTFRLEKSLLTPLAARSFRSLSLSMARSSSSFSSAAHRMRCSSNCARNCRISSSISDLLSARFDFSVCFHRMLGHLISTLCTLHRRATFFPLPTFHCGIRLRLFLATRVQNIISFCTFRAKKVLKISTTRTGILSYPSPISSVMRPQ